MGKEQRNPLCECETNACLCVCAGERSTERKVEWPGGKKEQCREIHILHMICLVFFAVNWLNRRKDLSKNYVLYYCNTPLHILRQWPQLRKNKVMNYYKYSLSSFKILCPYLPVIPIYSVCQFTHMINCIAGPGGTDSRSGDIAVPTSSPYRASGYWALVEHTDSWFTHVCPGQLSGRRWDLSFPHQTEVVTPLVLEATHYNGLCVSLVNTQLQSHYKYQP